MNQAYGACEQAAIPRHLLRDSIAADAFIGLDRAAKSSGNQIGGGQVRAAPSLQTALGDAHKTVSMLSEAIDMLEARIQSVMGPPSPATVGIGKDGEMSTSPAVSEANGLSIRLRELIARVEAITRRVEA